MEIDQLTVTSISLTLRTNTFLYESDDLVPLDTPIIVFLDCVTVTKRHSRTISSTIEVSFLHVVITPRFNIEYNLDVDEK